MMIQPKIRIKGATTYVGVSKELSLSHFDIVPLWRNFMQMNARCKLPSNSDFIAITNYPIGYFNAYNPNTSFIKTVGIEVDNDFIAPEGLIKIDNAETQYAIIEGITSQAVLPGIINEFLTHWLPSSSFRLLEKPHIEVIDRQHYLNTNEMTEDYWFPIALK